MNNAEMIDKIILIRESLNNAIEKAMSDLREVKKEMLEYAINTDKEMKAAVVDGICIVDTNYEPLSDVEFAVSCAESMWEECEEMTDHLNAAIDRIEEE